MDFKVEVRTVRKVVEEILAEDERARGDDKWLTFRVMRKFARVPISFDDFAKIPSLETVRRSRQLIQAEGLYRASLDVQERREKHRLEHLGYYAGRPNEVL